MRSIEFAFERLLLGRTDYVIYEEYQGYAILPKRVGLQIKFRTYKAISAELYFTLFQSQPL